MCRDSLQVEVVPALGPSWLGPKRGSVTWWGRGPDTPPSPPKRESRTLPFAGKDRDIWVLPSILRYLLIPFKLPKTEWQWLILPMYFSKAQIKHTDQIKVDFNQNTLKFSDCRWPCIVLYVACRSEKIWQSFVSKLRFQAEQWDTRCMACEWSTAVRRTKRPTLTISCNMKRWTPLLKSCRARRRPNIIEQSGEGAQRNTVKRTTRGKCHHTILRQQNSGS